MEWMSNANIVTGEFAFIRLSNLSLTDLMTINRAGSIIQIGKADWF
ncbi:hypothetical protein SFB21_0641 [Acinetobacter bouvetii]|uniref:Uncharacterized protein n=1 Tax=Acinetobacter bouvetii TaxID=202951 RepID=A0A811G6Z0_9GAMM|nr:hypothetical protein SFB21_0641 [Acinetobacter bouvetii]